jgi:hypothetical protein
VAPTPRERQARVFLAIRLGVVTVILVVVAVERFWS